MEGILVCGESSKDRVTLATKEVLRASRSLCDALGERLALIFLGNEGKEQASSSISLGAELVYIPQNLRFSDFDPENQTEAIVELTKKINPRSIIFSHNELGCDLAPRVAARLGSVACLDCIEISLEKNSRNLQVTKPVFGGRALAVWECQGDKPQVITLRKRAYQPQEEDPTRKGEIIFFELERRKSLNRIKLIEMVEQESRGISLEEAKIVVAGGGGIGSREGFLLLEELAFLLGAALGITRVPSEEGWMPSTLEIGQTGHVIAPDLYLAIGISGAPQHLAGCSNSKLIVAINKDKEANIFKEADIGIVADYKEVLPALIERLKATLEK